MGTPSISPEALIDQCQGMVRSLAAAIHRKLPSHVDLDDLIAYGQVGLVEAARDFDPDRGNRFSTYAYYRVRGAIYDGLSKMSWHSRAHYNRVRFQQMSNEVLRLEGQGGDPPAETDPESDMRWLRDITQTLAVVYLSTHREGGEESVPDSLIDQSTRTAPAVVMNREIHQRLGELIDALPAEASALIRATYFEGLTLQEAGRKLGISKSWASRLHAKTLQQLARSLRMEGISP
jgi:RNA polymerase sigma factor for flagellar operon FliA